MNVPLLVPPQHRVKPVVVAQNNRPSVTMTSGVLNLGKIGEARLDLIPTLAECQPGMKPTEYNVIIATAKAGEKSGSILKTDEYRESEEMAMQVGRIVAMSPLAFNYDQWKDFEDAKPKVGDIVWFARYAGALIEAAFDGQSYRMVKDKDVAAIIVEPTLEGLPHLSAGPRPD